MMRFLKSPWTTWICSLVLGGVFVYASWDKILDPPNLVKSIHNYCLVPKELVNLGAIYMPWFELLAGLAVIVGFGRRGGALGLLLLTSLFIAVLGFNLWRGHPTVCGCFGGSFDVANKLTVELKFAKMFREWLLDVGLVLLAVQVLIGTARGSPDTRDAG